MKTRAWKHLSMIDCTIVLLYDSARFDLSPSEWSRLSEFVSFLQPTYYMDYFSLGRRMASVYLG